MTIHFGGTLTIRDRKRHIPHEVEVPQGTTRLDILFAFEPLRVGNLGNQLTLSLFDPDGFRGATHRSYSETRVVLSAAEASPGFIPGPIPAGTWTIVIDTHIVLPNAPIQYHFDIEPSAQPVLSTAVVPAPGKVPSRGPGWFRGDLHAHTIHSDGHWDIPDLVAHGREYHLDFITLTDHNTVSGLAQMDSYTADDLLTMGGIELTTYYGHALALGVRQWIDWRVQPGGLTMPMIVEKVTEAGGLFVIAHPMNDGDPVCSGCDWAYPDMMPGNARFAEMWNSIWEADGNNNDGVKLWYQWLNAGYRIIGTAGTDLHQPMIDPEPGFNIVFAHELSEKAILAAIRRGHLFLSSGPYIELKACNTAGAEAMIGEYLPGKALNVSASWRDCNPDDCLTLMIDGTPHDSFTAEGQGEKCWDLTGKQACWCVVEIRNSKGRMRALTNPIFFSRQPGGWL